MGFKVGTQRPTVAQIHDTYLNLTENWIFHQVRFLRTARSIFLAKGTANLDQFPWDPVYALTDRGTLGRQWDRTVRNLLGFYPYFREVCRQEGVDLIHTHSGSVGRRMLPLAQALKVPLLTSFYGWEMFVHPEGGAGLRRKYRRLFASGAGFIAEGPAAAEQLVRIGCPAAKLEIHRLGVDPAEIPFTERGPGQDGSFRILMAARFDEKKGLPYGVEAVCREAREDARIRLTVVGDASSQPKEQNIREKLHELVRRFGMSERVQFTGFLSNRELHALAPVHHLFLHPSVRAENGDSEGGHPVVLTEMAATGMPIIATRHCDIPEIVIDEETGWLCRERSVDDLVAALRNAVASPSTLAEYGRRARHLVETKYNARVNTLDRVYQKFLQ